MQETSLPVFDLSGGRLVSIMRENSRKLNSLMMISDDEGETWSRGKMKMRCEAHAAPNKGEEAIASSLFNALPYMNGARSFSRSRIGFERSCSTRGLGS